MVDKLYLKNYLRKQEEFEMMLIRYHLLLDKDNLSSPAGKTDLPAGSAVSSRVENIVCKRIAIKEKIKELRKELIEQGKLINAIFEKLENPCEKLVMQMRYEDGFEWDAIRGKIFGSRTDYSVNIEKYNDKVFKIHGAALKHIKELQSEKNKKIC